MPVLICCVSNNTGSVQYVVKTIYKIIPISWPKFPYPQDGVIIPLDENMKKVTTEEQEITNVVIPYWYWNLIIEYKLNVDAQEEYYNRVRKTQEENS